MSANELEYQRGLSLIQTEGSQERSRMLVGTTAEVLRHFFDRDEYGTLPVKDGDVLPACWPYVRYLVADSLRPKLGYGPSKFVNLDWSDKFLSDVADEARQINQMLPKDLSHKEWPFMVKVAGYMLMNDPFLVDKGWITKSGRGRLVSQSLMTGFAPRDMYEMQFEVWKNKYFDDNGNPKQVND